MIVCPVCEHAQPQGSECDVCGRAFGARATVAPAVRLAELEVTAYAPVQPPAAEAFPDLETTSAVRVGRVASAPMTELDRGRAPEVDAPIDAVPDLDTGRHETVREATGAGPRTCRYCRNVQPDGAFCDRCGMRFPGTRSPASGARQAAEEEDARVRHGCGEYTRRGAPCDGCGQPVP